MEDFTPTYPAASQAAQELACIIASDEFLCDLVGAGKKFWRYYRKECVGCDGSKPSSEYNRQPRTNDGYAPFCRTCETDIIAPLRTTRREEIVHSLELIPPSDLAKQRAKGATYSASAKAVRWNAQGSFAVEEWIALCDRFGERCLRCLCPSDIRPLTVDHVIPLALGGTNNINNIQPLCKQCNASKKQKATDYRKAH